MIRRALRHRKRYDGINEAGEFRYMSCRCRCYGCKHHCEAHWPWWMRAAWKAAPSAMARRRDRMVAKAQAVKTP